MRIRLSIILLVCSLSFISAQGFVENLNALPVIKGTYLEGIENDWLLEKPSEKAQLFRNKESNEIILSNGIISRSFRLSPNATTISLKVLKGDCIGYKCTQIIETVKASKTRLKVQKS